MGAVKRKLARVTFTLRRLPNVLRQALREWTVLSDAKQYEVMEMDVRLHDVSEPHEQVLNRVSESLRVILEHDPRRFNRLRGDVARLVVRNAPGTQHWFLSNTCVLELRKVLNKSPATTALSIVHEATHARLVRAGILPVRRLHSRIEVRCLREERSFTLRLQATGYSGTEKALDWIDRAVQARQVGSGPA